MKPQEMEVEYNPEESRLLKIYLNGRDGVAEHVSGFLPLMTG